ncbi:hypothetical protein E27107_310002 [Elizabethkingia anophelis]|nr:hypothetical protein E18064_430013 [Elizabethkingia anophelis]CDN78557.1 hypothetical protein E27107_310002 [Elizabethkingia anophelis]
MGLKKLNLKVEFTKEQISKWRNTFKQERTAVLEKNYKESSGLFILDFERSVTCV